MKNKSKEKNRMRFLIDKLLFMDIDSSDGHCANRKIQRAKRLALIAIITVFITGSIMTAGYAYIYYNNIKDSFLAEPEAIEGFGTFNPSAVWFTQEHGNPYLIQGILAYLESYENGNLELQVVNVNDIQVKLVSIQNLDADFVYPFSEKDFLDPTSEYMPQIFSFENVQDAMMEKLSEIVVNYQYDDGIARQALVIPFKKMDEEVFNSTAIRTQDNTGQFGFVRLDNEFIYFMGDQVRIEEPLFIPSGKILRISAGQEIDIVNEAFIVSRSPVKIEGTESEPVHFFTSDNSGRGLIVLQAGDESFVNHAIFDGLDTQRSGMWELTGAVTFYESDVEISNSEFVNNPSEDGLNIIRSRFSIIDSYFGNTGSDAFDADFCQGVISGTVFEDTINDAIDVSGSQVEVRDTVTRNNGDKGISVGENSTLHLQRVSIDNAVVGMASKDYSHLTGENIQISNTRIALTLYIKKPEFGPAMITLDDVTLRGDIDIEYLIQPGSTLVIDGQTIQPRAAAKEALLFEKMINGEPIQ